LEKIFDATLQNRKLLYNILKNTPKDKLLEIPKNFNNNIWWNIAHVVVTQQLLVYKFSGLPMLVDGNMVDKYKKGTKPVGAPTDEEIETVKKLLFSTLEQTEADYKAGKFTEYNEYTTSANVTLSSADDALSFNLFHEGIHLGSILALLRNVS